MAGWLDVAGRVAEGLPAIEHMRSYLHACRQIGYRDPDLTGDPAYIADLYASEDGLDLQALGADCAALRAAGSVLTEALRLLRDQIAVLGTAWTGSGADSAVGLLQRHCGTAGAVVAEVRAAAQRCESLRDNLWHMVDAKVSTTLAIDDRTLAHRPAWLAAAASVMTQASAREVVDQQIKPYVDNDIRRDWRSAMLSAHAGITAAYDMVIDRLAAAPRVCFEVPGDFGTAGQPVRPATVTTGRAVPGTALPTGTPGRQLGTAPSTAASPLATHPFADAANPGPMPPTPAVDTGWSEDPGMSQGVGGLAGNTIPADLSGLAGLANRIIAALGDVLGPGADASGDDLFEDDAQDGREPDPLEAPDEPRSSEPVPRAGDVAVPASEPLGPPRPATESPGAGPRTPEPAAAGPPAAAPPPMPLPAASTPCEIAANELPQAGQ
ncbi:hypothetical protein ACX9NE_22580 [Mycobacterium sp. ML4]